MFRIKFITVGSYFSVTYYLLKVLKTHLLSVNSQVHVGDLPRRAQESLLRYSAINFRCIAELWLVTLSVMLLNGIKSDLLPVSMGIPQGLILGPTLFVLFTNDLPPMGSFICMQVIIPYTVLEKQLIWRSINWIRLTEFYNLCLNN